LLFEIKRKERWKMNIGGWNMSMNNPAASCGISKTLGNKARFGESLPGRFMRKAVLAFLVIVIVIAGMMSLGSSYASAQNTPFPTYGAGTIHVWIYTDYFCPPCRAMEPALEPVLKDLVKRNIITLTLVDTPFKQYSSLYARYFLYALNAELNKRNAPVAVKSKKKSSAKALKDKNQNEFAYALRVRNVLFDAAKSEQFSTKERIETLFKRKKIPFAAFDPKPAFDRFYTLMMEDKINSTPTCVIVKGGVKEQAVGGEDIINALKRIQ
jgi:thiol-disulfide isomerase/thioredoxin